MNEQQDPRLSTLLGQTAPPPRDPLFRVRVLVRREQREFRRRLYIMLVGLIAMSVISVWEIRAVGSLEVAGVPVVGVALASACLAFRRSLMRNLGYFKI